MTGGDEGEAQGMLCGDGSALPCMLKADWGPPLLLDPPSYRQPNSTTQAAPELTLGAGVGGVDHRDVDIVEWVGEGGVHQWDAGVCGGVDHGQAVVGGQVDVVVAHHPQLDFR